MYRNRFFLLLLALATLLLISCGDSGGTPTDESISAGDECDIFGATVCNTTKEKVLQCSPAGVWTVVKVCSTYLGYYCVVTTDGAACEGDAGNTADTADTTDSGNTTDTGDSANSTDSGNTVDDGDIANSVVDEDCELHH